MRRGGLAGHSRLPVCQDPVLLPQGRRQAAWTALLLPLVSNTRVSLLPLPPGSCGGTELGAPHPPSSYFSPNGLFVSISLLQ